VRDKTIDHCKKLANSKKNEIKKLENELKYLEELSNTSTYKEDTSFCIFFSFFIHFTLELICLPFVFSVYSLSSLLIVISSFCFNDVSSLYVLVLLSSSKKQDKQKRL
jgi:hypothetical protein